MIIDGYTAYQVKSGKSIEPWKESAIQKELFDKRPLGKEHLGSMVRDVLDRDGRYILVDFGHDLTFNSKTLLLVTWRDFCARVAVIRCLRSMCGAGTIFGQTCLIPFPSLTLNLKGIGRRVKRTQVGLKMAR